jgi:N-methylhydantoinase B/oxoprolinase/acetone carboxylase alpha subunit
LSTVTVDPVLASSLSRTGGLGVETKFKIGSDETQLVTFGDGDFEPAFGLFGGKDSILNTIELNYPDGTRVELMEPRTVDGIPAPSSTAPPPEE